MAKQLSDLILGILRVDHGWPGGQCSNYRKIGKIGRLS